MSTETKINERHVSESVSVSDPVLPASQAEAIQRQLDAHAANQVKDPRRYTAGDVLIDPQA